MGTTSFDPNDSGRFYAVQPHPKWKLICGWGLICLILIVFLVLMMNKGPIVGTQR